MCFDLRQTQSSTSPVSDATSNWTHDLSNINWRSLVFYSDRKFSRRKVETANLAPGFTYGKLPEGFFSGTSVIDILTFPWNARNPAARHSIFHRAKRRCLPSLSGESKRWPDYGDRSLSLVETVINHGLLENNPSLSGFWPANFHSLSECFCDFPARHGHDCRRV